ncbi:MAG: tetraacyldisaccharide 4'-kinase [Flavobacteriales bacterium]|nr:tetraacyldisaccharide 4'-kinase [Flavobacteriales bacterium]
MELVLRCLEGYAPLATLSRGYGRSGKELREVLETDTIAQSGDEPLLIKRKHLRSAFRGCRPRAVGRRDNASSG